MTSMAQLYHCVIPDHEFLNKELSIREISMSIESIILPILYAHVVSFVWAASWVKLEHCFTY